MAELYLSGVVGWDFTPDQVKDFVDQTTDDNITLFISSPGGFVMAGLEIYNILRASGKKIKTVNMALCASMASVIFLAGDERIAMSGSLYMVHKPSGLAWGNADDMRKEIEILDKMQESLQAIYIDRAGIENIQEMVDNETWLSVEDMKKIGVANSDEKIIFNSNVTVKNNENKEDDKAMAKIDDLNAELEKLRAENKVLKDEKAEREAEAEIAKLKAENDALNALKKEAKIKEKVPESAPKESEQTNSQEITGAKQEEDIEIIDTTKTVKSGANNIPAFLDFESKY